MLPWLVLLLTLMEMSDCQLPSPKGLHFLGVGYNLLKGNPEGGELANGGIDPGLLFTRKIFQLTHKLGKLSVDRKYVVPDQVVFAPRSSCVTTHKKDTFAGEKSYQRKLTNDVSASGGYDVILFNFAFTLSSRYEEVKKETSKFHNVFYEEKTVCNKGRARFQYDLATSRRFPVSSEFAAAVCTLPSNYSVSDYMWFLERWGTHIVLEAELGTKKVERYKSSLTEFTKYAMNNVESSVSASGLYIGFQGSLKVDFSLFQESMSSNTKFGQNKVTFHSGGDELPEPIALKLLPIEEALNPLYFEALDNKCVLSKISQTWNSRLCCSLEKRRTNLIEALRNYAKWKQAVPPKDPNLQIPVTWPLGTYGLPMPISGCQEGSGFPWHKGYRYHDTENKKGSNSWSKPFHISGPVWRNDMYQKFCMKTQERGTSYDMDWPRGQYCLFKKGECPKGFRSGYIRWDDEDKRNRNSYGGSVPDGAYGPNTVIFYCCRTDGHATNQIYLPTDKPFVLFPYTHQCQYVHGMRVSKEWFRWDTEDFWPSNGSGGSKPHGGVGKNIDMQYCYYYR